MPRRIGTWCLVLLASAALACFRLGKHGAIGDSSFVATMVDLSRIGADTMLDSTQRDSARTAVLRRHGVTATELERIARGMADDPKHALAVWQVIEQQVTGRPGPSSRQRPAALSGSQRMPPARTTPR